MRIFLFLSLFFCLNAAGGVGKVINLIGEDSYLQRGEEKIPLKLDLELEIQDQVHSGESIVVLYLHPSSQLSLSKNSQVQISESLLKEGEDLTRGESIIDLIKGLVRLQVVSEPGVELKQQIRAKDVSFGVRGTDFEVKLEEEEVLLDVYEGEVEVTSPHVNTFVPYYVKGNEGFRFLRKKHQFDKRGFSPRFRNAGFRKKEEIRERWRNRRSRLNERLKKRRSEGRRSAPRRRK